MNILVLILSYIIILALLFGFLCSVTGEEEKGAYIINYCITAFILILLVIAGFSIDTSQNGFFSHALPIVSDLKNNGSLHTLFIESPGSFAIDFVELVTLVLMINWIGSCLPFGQGGLVGKIMSKILIFFIACLAYGFFMEYMGEHPIMKWFVYIVECVITGSAIVYTPALMLSAYLNIKEGTFLSTYILSILPKTSLGKAISSSISTAIAFVLVVIVFELKSGSTINVLNDALSVLQSFGGAIVIVIGLYFIVNSVTKR